ncbi:MAG: hypothetical protein RLZ37_2078, partial [Actinomycetota bacterium]
MAAPQCGDQSICEEYGPPHEVHREASIPNCDSCAWEGSIDRGGSTMTLEDDLAVCVGCGLCLPHCPTFRVTGEESHSPRGRIALIRGSSESSGRLSSEVRSFLDTCVQCRGCEPACPSGVEYGGILAAANLRDEMAGRRPRLLLRIFLTILKHRRILDLIGRGGVLANSVPVLRRVLPERFRITGVSIRQGPRVRRHVSEPDVWLHTGCVMNSWFRSVHLATIALLEAGGRTVATPQVEGACCGALHLHAGSERSARELARTVMESMPGSAPIVVNAAGCGAMLKEYGELFHSPEAIEFSKRAVDIHEWIDHNLDRLRSPAENSVQLASRPEVIVQEPCHLRNVQMIGVADTLEKFVPVRRLGDDGLCCGAGGA